MAWTRTETPEGYEEWERDDGDATLRVRERVDGSYVVRLDRLEQASDGRDYRRERVADRGAADALLAEWKREFDRADGRDEE
ncbi:hypothetical protein Hbl1158_12395 [Halobaculum sp. CBA1158]|uniref:DUF7543 family protein n=1 Tax=Halobaculum sp. CBA1158 TaxID=2904243 RepID=UPI001F2814A8|nr:hypothetical protein [Halobaculum sp. CBA1158]UIO99321.1 hypothetical protein Hbl1158_12395 [Halobaculum sp. CBA1158]